MLGPVSVSISKPSEIQSYTKIAKGWNLVSLILIKYLTATFLSALLSVHSLNRQLQVEYRLTLNAF